MPLPEDPALRPVAAAQAAIDAAKASPPRRPAAQKPIIEPVDPRAWRMRVELAFPLIVDGAALDRLDLRMITGADISRLVMEEDEDHSLNIRARALVAGVHPAVFEALAGPDYERVAEAIRPFLPPSLVAADDRAAAALLDDVLSPEV